MNTELKSKITKCAERVVKEIASGELKPGARGLRLTQLVGASNARLFATDSIRQRLVNQRVWKEVSEAICQERLEGIVDRLVQKATSRERKAELSEARARQFELFPGFQALPTRIRSGNNFLKFPETTVSQFLAYAAKYEKRAQVNQQTADELRRLVEQVQPFAESAPDITVADAFSRAAFQQPKLAVVK